MPTGTVKWFNDMKGFGYITQDSTEEDVFLHHTALDLDGYRTVVEGQRVEFDVKRGPKGLQASNVRILIDGKAYVPPPPIKVVPLKTLPRMEARVRIGDTELTEAQSMALRVAVTHLQFDMSDENALGADGKGTAKAYHDRSTEILALIFKDMKP